MRNACMPLSMPRTKTNTQRATMINMTLFDTSQGGNHVQRTYTATTERIRFAAIEWTATEHTQTSTAEHQAPIGLGTALTMRGARKAALRSIDRRKHDHATALWAWQ